MQLFQKTQNQDSVEIGIDGELGFVILGNQLILNRIKEFGNT